MPNFKLTWKMDGKFSHRSTNLDQANQALSLLHTGLLLDLLPKVLCGVHCLNVSRVSHVSHVTDCTLY